MSNKLRTLILGIGIVVGAVVGWLVVVATPSQYQASSTVLVDVAQVEDTDQLAQLGSYTRQQINNYAQLATTQRVLEPVVEELSLDLPAQQLSSQISTSVPMDSTTVEITATGDSPRRAAELADGVAESLVASIREVAPTGPDGDALVRGMQVSEALEPREPSTASPMFGAAVGVGLGLVVGLFSLLVISSLKPRVAGAH